MAELFHFYENGPKRQKMTNFEFSNFHNFTTSRSYLLISLSLNGATVRYTYHKIFQLKSISKSEVISLSFFSKFTPEIDPLDGRPTSRSNISAIEIPIDTIVCIYKDWSECIIFHTQFIDFDEHEEEYDSREIRNWSCENRQFCDESPFHIQYLLYRG